VPVWRGVDHVDEDLGEGVGVLACARACDDDEPAGPLHEGGGGALPGRRSDPLPARRGPAAQLPAGRARRWTPRP
jgi:hypothetical protein